MPSLYGIIDSRDLKKTVVQYSEGNLATVIRDYLAGYNAQVEAIMGEFGVFTTDWQERYYLPVGGEMDESDEYSRGVATRTVLPFYDVAYPILQFDTRKMWTQIYLAKADVTKVDQDFDNAQLRDRNTMLKQVLRGLLYKTNWTFEDDQNGTLTIRRLLNGDGTVPPETDGMTFDGTHTHYLGTNGALTTAFLRDYVYEHLRHHGNGGNVVIEASRNVAASIALLTGFVKTENRRDARVSMATNEVVATAQSERAIGRIENMEVRIMPQYPDNYFTATDLASEPPLAFREDEEEVLRGLVLTQDSPNDMYPLQNAFFRRRIGVGVRNRANGVAVFVNGTANYTDPTI